MAEETTPQEEVESAPSESEAADKPANGWKARISRFRQAAARHWFVGLITIALVGHAAGLWMFALQQTAQPEQTGEVDLGRFEYRNTSVRRGEVSAATFALHVRFIDEVESRARGQLADRRFRVEQDIEEILRQAHGADFADPHIRELKRQFAEQINRSLELRSVSDVIITDLNIESTHAAARPTGPDHDELGDAALGEDASRHNGSEHEGGSEHDDGAQVANEVDWTDTPAS
jgi:flagellar basal body-associated protein FliL